VLYDGLCKVRFADNSIAWKKGIDIYPSRMELLLAWEDTMLGLIVKATKAVEDCRSQICAEGRGVLYHEALKGECADTEPGDK